MCAGDMSCAWHRGLHGESGLTMDWAQEACAYFMSSRHESRQGMFMLARRVSDPRYLLANVWAQSSFELSISLYTTLIVAIGSHHAG